MPSQPDSILDELNGGAMPPMVDPAPEPAPTRDAELTVKAPAAQSPIAAADAVHATKYGGTGYRVRVKGEYYATAPDVPGKKVKKPYELAFNLPALEGALSKIKNKLLLAGLKRLDPAATGDRTCRIVDATPLSPATPRSNNVATMDRQQLEALVRTSNPPIPIADPSVLCYPDVTDLRDSITDYIQNPVGFAGRESARQAERDEARELAAMNPDIGTL